MSKNTIWIPKQEYELWKEYRNKRIEDSKNMDWGAKAYLQLKFERGDFNDSDPIIREDMRLLAYGGK